MRAAWWWVDRWRKSSAYTRLTLEEQGAYRNLLDELWLRDGVLENDDRYLANVCGDAVRWPEIRARVLSFFQLTPEGWRNQTHDEVMAESVRRAEKQKRYRKRRVEGNSDGNVTGNGDGNKAGSPSPSPSLHNGGLRVGGEESTARPPTDRAEKAITDNVDALQLRLGGLLARLAEHPNSRLMVPAWSAKVTSYRKGDRDVGGRQDFRMIRSPERLQKSIGDAEDWLRVLDEGKVVFDGGT